MKRAALDPSKRLDLYMRVNRINTKAFDIVNSDGSDFSMIYEDFNAILKRYPGDYDNTLLLTVGNGLSIDGNRLYMDITADQCNLPTGEYYWELYKPDDEQTWLSGKVYFHDGEFDGVINDPTTLQIEEDSPIQITINL